MCGRYTLRTPPRDVARLFDLPTSIEYEARYNIAPSQKVLAIRQRGNAGPREAAWLNWGLIPFWAKDPSIANRLINARSESAAEKPAFRAALVERRCLIPADGFYEWKKEGKRRIPHFISLQSEEPYAYAGLWERWNSPTGPIETCTILTTRANELLAPLHERMPVILDRHDFAEWLDPRRRPEELAHLFEPFPASRLELRPVSSTVNSPRNESAECLAPWDDSVEEGAVRTKSRPDRSEPSPQRTLFD